MLSSCVVMVRCSRGGPEARGPPAHPGSYVVACSDLVNLHQESFSTPAETGKVAGLKKHHLDLSYKSLVDCSKRNSRLVERGSEVSGKLSQNNEKMRADCFQDKGK